MKIIIIILICLFFSLSIPNINEFLTALQSPPPVQTPTTGPAPEQPIDGSSQKNPAAVPTTAPAPAADGSLQTQVNMLSTQITSTNAIAVEAKKKVDDIASQIDQLKEALKKAPDT